jgi:ATP-dependent Clp protease ATP-binding subunit ClpA
MEPQLSDEGERAMGIAEALAQRLGSASVEPEHVFLALLRFSSARQALTSVGLPVVSVDSELSRLGARHTARDGERTGWTKESRKILAGAFREAAGPTATRPGVEHLLVAALHDPGSRPMQVLAEFGCNPDDIQQAARDALPRSIWQQIVGPVPPEFRLFTAEARKATLFAQDKTLCLGHTRVDSEHLLLGLFGNEEWLSARLLDAYGVRTADAESLLLRIRSRGYSTARVPFAGGLYDLFSRGARDADALGSPVITTGHLLLALLNSDASTVVGRMISQLSLDPASIRRAVAAAVGETCSHEDDRLGGDDFTQHPSV